MPYLFLRRLELEELASFDGTDDRLFPKFFNAEIALRSVAVNGLDRLE